MSKARIGIIGAGWWAAESHIPVLQSRADVEVTAVCRLGQEELEQVKTRFGIPFGTEDHKELIAYDHLDGVVICSPHHLHFEQALAALQQGLHVVCEKPMCLYANQARQIQALVEARGLHFLIPYGWNYTDFASVAREKIQQGVIGRIQHVQCHMASALRDLFSGEGLWLAEKAFFKPEKRTWSEPSVGGGFAHGQLTHALGLLLWITDLEPTEVFALMGGSPTGADLFNSISCRFKDGVTGMIGGAATMPLGSPYQVDIRVFGTEGMLLLDVERPRLEVRCNDGQLFSMPMSIAPGAYACAEPLNVFIDLLHGKPAENRSTAGLGSRVVEIIDAAFRSVKTQTCVKV